MFQNFSRSILELKKSNAQFSKINRNRMDINIHKNNNKKKFAYKIA